MTKPRILWWVVIGASFGGVACLNSSAPSSKPEAGTAPAPVAAADESAQARAAADRELAEQMNRLRGSGAAAVDVEKSFTSMVAGWRIGLRAATQAQFAEERCWKGGCTVTMTFPKTVPYEAIDTALLLEPGFAHWTGAKFRSGVLSVDHATARMVWILFADDAAAGAAPAPGAAPPVPGAAPGFIEYRGPVYARTSGNACRDGKFNSDDLSYTKTGVKNATRVPVSVWCPIIRRNSTPNGTAEKADGAPDGSFVPTTKLDKLTVDVRFTPDTTATSCTAYGRLAGALGGLFFSPARATCNKGAPDCAGGERTQTLTWFDPMRGPHPLVNLGVRCQLASNAGIVGSVASFSGELAPAALVAP